MRGSLTGGMKMRLSRLGLIVLPALVALAAWPRTAAADDWETCDQQSGDVAIAACSRAIASGRYKGNDLGVLYNNRGVENSSKGDRDRAIADFDQAIRLNPKYAYAYSNRGDAWRVKGDLKRALADLDQAIRLEPKFANAYYNRGLARERSKDLQGALADFKTFAELAPSDPDGPRAVERVTTALGGR
jgi:tetratricopeptide (TPR) repeat protein